MSGDFFQDELMLIGPRSGKSAYAYAVEGGYTGTEEEFAVKLAALMNDGIMGTIDENNNIILSGSLSGGTYTAYYELTNSDGTKSLVEIGELTLAEEEIPEPEPAAPTNFFKSAPVVTDKVYGAEDAILAGGRVNDSGEYRHDGGRECLLTNYISVQAGDEIEMTNLSFYTTLKSAMYKSDKTMIGGFLPESGDYVTDVTTNGTVQTFKIAHEDAGYVRICGTPDSGTLKDSTAGLMVHQRYDLTQVSVNVKRDGEYL